MKNKTIGNQLKVKKCCDALETIWNHDLIRFVQYSNKPYIVWKTYTYSSELFSHTCIFCKKPLKIIENNEK